MNIYGQKLQKSRKSKAQVYKLYLTSSEMVSSFIRVCFLVSKVEMINPASWPIFSSAWSKTNKKSRTSTTCSGLKRFARASITAFFKDISCKNWIFRRLSAKFENFAKNLIDIPALKGLKSGGTLNCGSIFDKIETIINNQQYSLLL